jgi:hypothetical protein
LLRYFNRDIADVGGEQLSWRRLGNLLRRLPRESELMREVHGPAAVWGPTEHLLAAVVDRLALANWQRGGDKRAQRPKPIPRPGDAPSGPARTALSPNEMHARLLEQRQRRGRESHPGR